MAGSSQGTAYVDVLPDMRGYFREIRREIDQNNIIHKIKVAVASASLVQLRRDIQNKFDQQTFKIGVEASAAGLTALRQRIDTALGRAFTLDVNLSAAALTQVRQQIGTLSGAQVEISVRASRASLQVMRVQIEQMLNRSAFSIDIQLNTASASLALNRFIASNSGRSINVNVDVDRNGGIKKGIKALGILTKTIGIAALAGGGLGAVGIAAGAIGALALGAMPAMLGLAAVMGTVALGAEGIKEAFATVTPQFDALKASASAGFKDALLPAMEGVGNLLTGLQEPIKQLSGAIGGLMSQMLGVLTSPEGIKALQDITTGISNMVTAAGPGLTSMITSFRDLFASLANSGALTTLGAAFGSFFKSIGDAFAKLSADGTMDKLVNGFSQILTALGPVFGQLITVFAQLGAALAPVIAQLLTAFMPVLTALTPIMTQMGQVLGDTLIKVFESLAPVLPVLAKAFGDIFEALAPVIVQLVDALAPVIEELAPVLAQVGQAIAGALSDAIKSIAPYLPQMAKAFGDLVIALLPLLPVIVKLATDLLPILLPLIIKIVEVFTAIANVILPILIPALEFLIGALSKVYDFVIDKIIKALDWVKEGFEKLADVISVAPQIWETFKDAVGKAVDWVQEKWDGLVSFFQGIPEKISSALSGAWDGFKKGFKAAINYIIDGWNNFSITLPEIDTHIPGVGKVGGWTLDTPNIPRLATGGAVVGQGWLSAPGTTTSDGGLFYGSNKEFVVNAKTMASPAGAFIERANAAKGIPRFAEGGNIGGAKADPKKAEWLKFLESIGYKTPFDPAGNGAEIGKAVTGGITSYKEAVGNIKGWADVFISGGEIPGMEQALRPVLGLGNPDTADATPTTYAGPGADNSTLTATKEGTTAAASAIQAAVNFAKGESGKDYQYGGVGNPSWDCSGFMSGIYATIRGLDAHTRWFTTEADFTGNALGFVKGAGPGGSDGFGIGVHNGGGGQYSHMAGTLGGTPVESGGNGVLYGSPALGADASQFESRYYLPIVKEAAEKVANAVADMATPEGAGVARWRDQVVAAMRKQGFNADDPAQVDAMMSQIGSESSGDEKAIQKVIDVNSGGNEAGGLLQVVPGTFSAYRDPSLPDDRFNGFANMNAALRYYKERYGTDLTTQWGRGHGYDNGGTINGMGLFGKWTNRPEEVLSPNMTQDFHDMLPFMGTVADHLRSTANWGEADDTQPGGTNINLKFGDVKANSWEDAQAQITTNARRGMRSVLGGTVGGR